jgi:asparaginyl-tRNA synthetase
MKELLKIKEVLAVSKFPKEVIIKGWVRTFRSNRFIAMNDGSTINNIQCVIDFEKFDESIIKRITTSAALCIEGTLVESQGKGQTMEIQVSKLKIPGDSDPEKYPIQPKKHS